MLVQVENDILTMALYLFVMADLLIMPPKQRGRPRVVPRTTRSTAYTPPATGNPPNEADIARIINEQLAATIPTFLAQFQRDMVNGPTGSSNPGRNGGPEQPVGRDSTAPNSPTTRVHLQVHCFVQPSYLLRTGW